MRRGFLRKERRLILPNDDIWGQMFNLSRKRLTDQAFNADTAAVPLVEPATSGR
jgi:hypothetical protein